MSEVKCWEMLDSMSGSVTNEQEQGEVLEVRRRYLLGQTLGFNSTVLEINKYAPPYVSADGSGVTWLRKRVDITGVGNRYFDCTVTYQTLVPKQEPEGGGNSPVPGGILWDTTGHTEHMTQAYGEEVYGDETVSFEGAINVSGDTVNGIDVVRPGMRYSETWILPAVYAMDCANLWQIYYNTGSVNAATFRCFAPGECLFLGARGQWQGDQPYVVVTFDFEARPNETVNLSPGLPGVVFEKEGWQYYWIRYQTDTNNDTLIQRPIAAYLNTIYQKKDWAGLGLGGRAPGQQPQHPQEPVPPLQDFGWNANP